MTDHPQAYQAINELIERLEQDSFLYVKENFIERMEARDRLEFELLNETELISEDHLRDSEKSSLLERSRILKSKLEEANGRLFTHLLARIQAHDWDTVRHFFQQAEQQITSLTDDVSYDELDMLINGLLEVDLVPAESRTREAEMCFYQPTRGRIILKVIDLIHPTPADIFYDIGSGLGHVPILINLLTGAKTRGVEFDGSYVDYSIARVEKLGLRNVWFIQADARELDYSDGTIFYLYTPFRGGLLEQVLLKLKSQSEQRPIKVCAYGPCTAEVSKQNWLRSTYQSGKGESHLGLFESLSAGNSQ